eukprot:UN04782
MMMITVIVMAIGVIFGVHGQAYHAHCDLEITVFNEHCLLLNSFIINQTNNRIGFGEQCKYSDLGNEFCGYSTSELTESKIHLQHETPQNHYIDDIYFSFKEIVSDKYDDPNYYCLMRASSVSEARRYYDYDTNYCNMFNLLRYGNSSTLNFNISIQIKDCKFHPNIDNKQWTASIQQCNTY